VRPVAGLSYVEFLLEAGEGISVGVALPTISLDANASDSPVAWMYGSASVIYHNSVDLAVCSRYSKGAVIGVAYNDHTGMATFYKNGGRQAAVTGVPKGSVFVLNTVFQGTRVRIVSGRTGPPEKK